MSAVEVLAGPSLAVNSEPYKSGPIGLAVILILVVACFFLFRSMSRRMKNVRENFPGEQRDAHGRLVAPDPSAAPDAAQASTAVVDEPTPPTSTPPPAGTRPPRATPKS